MEGSATFTTVVSRTIISMPTQRTTKAVQRWRSSRCCSVGFMVGSSCSGEWGSFIVLAGEDGMGRRNSSRCGAGVSVMTMGRSRGVLLDIHATARARFPRLARIAAVVKPDRRGPLARRQPAGLAGRLPAAQGPARARLPAPGEKHDEAGQRDEQPDDRALEAGAGADLPHAVAAVEDADVQADEPPQ